MDQVFRVINELVQRGVIETYAIGGAIAAIFYVEPFSTVDVDIFLPVSAGGGGLLIDLSPVYSELRSMGFSPQGEAVLIHGWPVQFLLVYNSLVEEALQHAVEHEIEGIPVRVLTPEYLIAIALQTGRWKDFARINMFQGLDVTDMDAVMKLIKRYDLEDQWQKYKAIVF